MADRLGQWYKFFMAGAARGAIDTLSSNQVSLLLRTLAYHKDLLEASHQDAKRLLNYNKRPAYLIDYQLLHRLVYERDRPDRVVELEYLFEQDDLIFLIGSGTNLELRRRLYHLSDIDTTAWVTPPNDYESFLRGILPSQREVIGRTLKEILEKRPADYEALLRLRTLLDRSNFRVLEGANVDDDTFSLARSVLEARRPSRSINNLMDALNFAEVVALRADKSTDFFPFLLTDTPLLLDENFLANDPLREIGIRSTISRDPVTAIYGHVAQRTHSDPGAAAHYTTSLAFQAARIEFELRTSTAYARDVPDRPTREWEQIAIGHTVGEGLGRELRLLSEFVSDPLIAETQRIYDNSRTAQLNWLGQRTSTHFDYGRPRALSSPRRLFDLILGLTRSLDAGAGAARKSFGTLWRHAIKLEVLWHSSYATASFRDSGSGLRAPFLVIEWHPPREEASAYFIFRWTSEPDIEGLLASFNSAYSRHSVSEVVVEIGSTAEVEEYDGALPLTVADLSQAFGEQVSWIRLNSPEFDLYADILTTDLDRDPLVGVIAEEPDWDHLADLFTQTSARFLFRPWVDAMLTTARVELRKLPFEGEFPTE